MQCHTRHISHTRNKFTEAAMRPILLGFAAAAMFVGGVMMAPLTSDLAVSGCLVGTSVVAGPACAPAGSTQPVRLFDR